MEFYSELPYEDFSYYNTPSTHEVGGSILTGILMFYLIILLVGLTVAVVNYIFRGIGMYNMAKREGMDYHGWRCTICQTYFRESLANGTSEK